MSKAMRGVVASVDVLQESAAQTVRELGAPTFFPFHKWTSVHHVQSMCKLLHEIAIPEVN
eukprot:COSAG04_NODE_618_length_11896_cov_81.925659_22_plen_60_part_00